MGSRLGLCLLVNMRQQMQHCVCHEQRLQLCPAVEVSWLPELGPAER